MARHRKGNSSETEEGTLIAGESRLAGEREETCLLIICTRKQDTRRTSFLRQKMARHKQDKCSDVKAAHLLHVNPGWQVNSRDLVQNIHLQETARHKQCSFFPFTC
jgi:hypothetical protein